jgi:hypothetical protein
MPIASRPLIMIEPVRLPVSPISARSVVVRPAPLRPSRLTHSPRRTVKSMPCRMWDSP